MKLTLVRYAKSQGGYTLVELIVASAIGLFVMTGLTSVVLTSWRAGTIATSRIEASGQVRNFQFEAYDDFARSTLPPIPAGCAGTQANPCTTQPIVLTGKQVANIDVPAPSPYNYTVTYKWDGAAFLDRSVGGNLSHVATSVTPTLSAPNPFFWYVDGQTVVVTLTVTVGSYAETQTLRFYPRVNS